MRTFLGVLVAAAIVAMAGPAVAQSEAEAEQLFRDGKQLMQDGKFKEACDAFEASNRVAPAITTLLNLADCREKNGQLATAWVTYLEVERKTRDDAKQKSVSKVAKERAAAIEPRLSYLTISVPRESVIDGLQLTRDGKAIDEGLWNRAVPIDGGSYTIGGHAPGHEQWSTVVNVPIEKGRVSVDVPKFKNAERLVVEGNGGDDDDGDELVDTPSTFTGKRKAALGVGAVGVLAFAGGVVLGMQAKTAEDDALAICQASPCARADEANELGDKAESRALLANVSFGVAAVAVAGAAFLWFTGAPESHESATAFAPVLTPSYAGLDVAVRF